GHRMLKLRRGQASDRKRRLFGVACSRRVWGLLDPLARAAVEVAERFADGQAGAEELRAARLACQAAGAGAAWYAAASRPAVAARNAALSAQAASAPAERAAQAAALDELFGNPLRAAGVAPAWQTPAVVALARGIYEERAFGRMPLLAGALAEAGCADEEVLAHCRVPGGHIRGCWVLDLLSGRG